MDLSKHLLDKAPSSVYYVPNFISEIEEKELLEKVYSAPKPKWTYLSHRRLQNWGGLPHPKGMVAEPLPSWLKIYAEKIHQLGQFEDKMPNHVLVNEYLPGQGIMPHEDGPLFFPVVATISLGSSTMLDFYYHRNHKATSVSTENDSSMSDPSPVAGDASDPDDTDQSLKERHFTSILLERRSLILVCEDMYKIHLHGIDERKEDVVTDRVANLTTVPFSLGDKIIRETRVSLTIRHVPKVVKSKLLFGKGR